MGGRGRAAEQQQRPATALAAWQTACLLHEPAATQRWLLLLGRWQCRMHHWVPALHHYARGTGHGAMHYLRNRLRGDCTQGDSTHWRGRGSRPWAPLVLGLEREGSVGLPVCRYWRKWYGSSSFDEPSLLARFLGHALFVRADALPVFPSPLEPG